MEVAYKDETVESFDASKQRALCAKIESISGDPTATCVVTSVIPASTRRWFSFMRRLMQGGGVIVTTKTVFRPTPGGAPSPAAANLVQSVQSDPQVLGEGATVENVQEDSVSEDEVPVVPEPVPEPQPDPSPIVTGFSIGRAVKAADTDSAASRYVHYPPSLPSTVPEISSL